ncbi:unnamed protein product, partial [Darwinula stevensoni]
LSGFIKDTLVITLPGSQGAVKDAVQALFPHVFHVFKVREQETGRIDMDKVAAKAREVQPKLIICGASAYSRDWDYKKFREIADEVDIAHPAGLIAADLLTDPLPHCHIVSSTTHKTLRGPRGGIIMLGKDFANPWGRTTKKGDPIMMSTILNSAVFPGMQGGPLEHVIAAKAIAFGEASQDSFKEYGKQVIANASVMAKAFTDRGYQIISGGTDNHMMLIDLRAKSADISGKDAENALVKADITINKNMVPFDSRPALHTSGIRVGECYSRDQVWYNAINAYHKAIELENRREEYYLGLAKAYLAVEDYNKATVNFQMATQTGPEDTLYWKEYICFLIKMGLHDEAIQVLDEAEDHTYGPDLLYCRAVTEYFLKNKMKPVVTEDATQKLRDLIDATEKEFNHELKITPGEAKRIELIRRMKEDTDKKEYMIMFNGLIIDRSMDLQSYASPVYKAPSLLTLHSQAIPP